MMRARGGIVRLRVDQVIDVFERLERIGDIEPLGQKQKQIAAGSERRLEIARASRPPARDFGQAADRVSPIRRERERELGDAELKSVRARWIGRPRALRCGRRKGGRGCAAHAIRGGYAEGFEQAFQQVSGKLLRVIDVCMFALMSGINLSASAVDRWPQGGR